MNYRRFMNGLSLEDIDILERASELLRVSPEYLYNVSIDFNTIQEEIADAKLDIKKIIVKGNSSLIWFNDGSFTIEDL